MSGTTHTTACCMNASRMAFVPKEYSEGTHSLLKIFLMTILTHTFSRQEPKCLLVPRVEKAKSSQSWLQVCYFTSLFFVTWQFIFKSSLSLLLLREYKVISMLSHFIPWDGWLYMGPRKVSFDSCISCTWHVVVSPYFRHLCLVLDGFR